MSDLVEKALTTNGCNFLEFARESNFNKLTIQKRIDALDKERKDLKTQYLIYGLNDSDLKHLQAIDPICDSLIENLKSENLRCNCEQKQFTRTVDENSNPICGGCGKII